MADPITPIPASPGGDELDESVTWATIIGLWVQALIAGSVAFFALLLVFSILVSSVYSGLVLGSTGAFLVFCTVLLAATRQEQVGEWRVLLPDRARSVPSVYSKIVGGLRDRRTPVYAQVRRTPMGPDTVGNRLIMIDGHYRVCVSVFAYGSCLYLGWIMWRTRRGATLVGRYLADLVTGMTGRLDPLARLPRAERARALREAAQGLCREGMHVAVETIDVPDSYGFPHGLPPIDGPPR